jgi:chromosome segregation ATPase
MAAKTTADKFDEVKEGIHELDKKVDLSSQLLHQTSDRVGALEELVHELRVAQAVLRTELDDVQKSRDTWGQRWWQIAAGLAIAVAGGVVGYLLKR